MGNQRHVTFTDRATAVAKSLGARSPIVGRALSQIAAVLMAADDDGQRTQRRRGYDAATKGRRAYNWNPPDTSGNAEVAANLVELRKRSHDAIRNNAAAAQAISVLAHYMVGTGITPRVVDGPDQIADRAMDLWDAWTRACNADGTPCGFYAMQLQAARALFSTGEVLVRRRMRSISAGLAVPIQLQLLEGHYLSDKQGQTDGGNIITTGVEVAATGRIEAYWLYTSHPGDTYVGLGGLRDWQPARIDAADVAHIYVADRPGQLRGVPALTPVLLPLRDLQIYTESEVLRKGYDASHVAIVSGYGSLNDPNGQTINPRGDAADLETYGPLTALYLDGDRQVTITKGSQTIGYHEFISTQLKEIAAGVHVPYELLSGDNVNAKYSSIRQAMLQFNQYLSGLQHLVFIPLFCDRIWGWFVDAAILAGQLPAAAADLRVVWTPDAVGATDPEKEINALVTALRAGLISWSEAVETMGGNPREVLAQMKKDQADLGIDGTPDWGRSEPQKELDE